MTIHSFDFADSTMLSNCSYDDKEKELSVTFKTNGRTYTYSGVPIRTFSELIEAKSPGKYFNMCKKDLKQK